MTNVEIIQKVIQTGEKQEIPMQPLNTIEKSFKELGFNDFDSEEEDTNGWAVDFWYTFTHPALGDYTVSGSLWEEFPWEIYKGK